MDPVLKISPEALEQFQLQLAKARKGVIGFRLGLVGGGCSGFSYYLGFEDDPPGTRDLSWEEGGVTFIVDKKSALMLSGSTVTWTKTLLKQGFDFQNPHESSRCGCGHSFSAK